MNYNEARKKLAHYHVPEIISNCVLAILQRFAIDGQCDPMYIANSIALFNDMGDGKGSFKEGIIKDFEATAADIQSSYGCNIRKTDISELAEIIRTGEINLDVAEKGMLSMISELKIQMKTAEEWRVEYLQKQIHSLQENLVGFKNQALEDNASRTVLFGRIYKSLPLNDFMGMASFLFAQGGLYLGPCISNFNYEMRNSTLDETEKKRLFMDNAIKEATAAKEHGVSINVTDMGEWGYYTTVIMRKE